MISVVCYAVYTNESLICQCIQFSSDIIYTRWLICIVRASILPIFILTLIINYATAEKRTKHFIFFQCHLVAYFLYFCIHTAFWIVKFSCTYIRLIIQLHFSYFNHCIFNFLAMMSVDMFLAFCLFDSRNNTVGNSIARRIRKHVMLIGQLYGWFVPILIALQDYLYPGYQLMPLAFDLSKSSFGILKSFFISTLTGSI